jgi:hypothetical protein
VQKTFVIAFILLLFTTLASAQSANIFFGYSYAHAGLVQNNGTNLNGWNGSLEGKFLPWVGLVADLGGYYGSQTVPGTGVKASGNVYTFMFGPQVSVSVGKLTPFAHVLVGAGHTSASVTGYSNSDTSFATALGGGVDYKLVKGLAWRGQLDFLQTRFYSNTQNNVRFSTGIVLRF